MSHFARHRMLSALSVGLFLAVPLLIHFYGQQPAPSPSSSPSASPTASPTPSIPRAPSPTPLPGAQNFHQWGSITVFNGLPSDSVRAIAQTPDGLMWFGTDNGLARFDGRRVQNFSPAGPETNSILALKTAPSGDLWVGTRSGAFVYSANRFQPIGGTKDLGITTILLRKETFLGTDNGFVLRASNDPNNLPTATPLYTDAIHQSDGTPASITGLVERNGDLIASTDGRGLLVVKDGNVSTLPIQLRTPFVNAWAADEGEGLWLGTEAAKGASGIHLVEEGGKVTRIAAPTADVSSLQANDGGLWAGTERYGLFHIQATKLKKNYTFENTSGGLRSNTVFTLFTDREGVLWIGTNRGVSRFDRLGASQETVSDTPNGNFIRTLYRVSDDSILAGSNRGLFRHEGESWRPVPGFDGKVIYAIAKQRNGQYLIGSASGLFDLSGKLISNGDVRSFASFQGRTYAAVFGRGVQSVDGQQIVWSDESTTAMCEGSDRLWIGTAGRGLFSFDGKTIRKEIEPEVLKSGTIWKMFVAADGVLWIAGQHGVFRVRDGQSERIVEAEDVRDVLVDGDDIWAATTTRGLLHARNDPRFGWLVSSVGFEQGLPSEKAFSILPAGGGLLIATNRGVVTYKPGSVEPKIIATRVLSQRVHDLAELAAPIDLEYPQNSLLVEVAGQSSRTFPEEFQYAFVLKNAKGEEVTRQLSNDPQYAPTDLKPGDYAIEAVAFNRDLLASEPLTIRFSIAKAPFPWTATALGVLLAIAVLGLVWAVFEHRRIRLRNLELKAARFDLANEAERERSRIARDLHDQTLADLRDLMIKSDKGALDKIQFRHEIESVSTDIRRICEDLSPSVLENVGLIAAIEFLLARTIENHRFNSVEGVEEKLAYPLNVQLQIYRIVQEVLTNIKKHSTADLVEIGVEMPEDSNLVLTVTDNGTTFEPNGSAAGGRGISNIKARANLIGARVAWQQRRSGNVFSLTMKPR